MFSQIHQSRFKPTKRKRHQLQLQRLPILIKHLTSYCFNHRSQSISQLITLLFGPIALTYYVLSMSMFYQVMGAVKCRKLKKHPGIALIHPNLKPKESYAPNDMVIFKCESADPVFQQTLRCLDDGTWSEIPSCPDPTNYTCPDLEPIQHGSYTSSSPSPYKVGTKVYFRCENELLSNINPSSASSNNYQQNMNPTTIASEPQITFQSHNISATNSENFTNVSAQPALRYNLTGQRVLKCLPSAKWNYHVPTCSPIYPDPPSNVGFLLASAALILIPILILAVLFHLFIRWRKRQQQRERWKQYFTDYKYRHSKTSITFANRPNSQAAVPVTDL